MEPETKQLAIEVARRFALPLDAVERALLLRERYRRPLQSGESAVSEAKSYGNRERSTTEPALRVSRR